MCYFYLLFLHNFLLSVLNILMEVFDDCKSACETVWHENLIEKFARIGIHFKTLNRYKQRIIKVKYGNSYSRSNILQIGLPQEVTPYSTHISMTRL